MTTLANRTRIAILVEDDTGQVTQFLAALTAIIGLLLVVVATVRPVFLLAGDVLTAADFTVKVLAIGLAALAFGLGVKR